MATVTLWKAYHYLNEGLQPGGYSNWSYPGIGSVQGAYHVSGQPEPEGYRIQAALWVSDMSLAKELTGLAAGDVRYTLYATFGNSGAAVIKRWTSHISLVS